MKINLECGNDLRNGYLNIHSSPVPETEGFEFRVGDYRNLDGVVEDEHADEIVATNLMNKMPPEVSVHTLIHWKEKLKIGGVLKLVAIDIRQVCREGHVGSMSLLDLHQHLFGPNHEFVSLCDTDILRNTLQQHGFKIKSITHGNCSVSIEAIKQ